MLKILHFIPNHGSETAPKCPRTRTQKSHLRGFHSSCPHGKTSWCVLAINSSYLQPRAAVWRELLSARCYSTPVGGTAVCELPHSLVFINHAGDSEWQNNIVAGGWLGSPSPHSPMAPAPWRHRRHTDSIKLVCYNNVCNIFVGFLWGLL